MRKHSKRYKSLSEKFERGKVYSLAEGLQLVKKSATAKFPESVEAHVVLGLDKIEQQIRGVVLFPNPIGRKIKVAAFVSPAKEKDVKEAGADLVGGEELVNKIKETNKTDFDIAVAEPVMMRHLGKIAKILGPKGLMPSPKTETVTPNPAKAIHELKAGKISFKADPTGCVHQIIGKVSLDEKKLEDNFRAFMEALKKAKPAKSKGVFIKSITLCSTMGPGIKIKF